MLKSIKSIINEARVMGLEEGSDLEVSKEMVIDFYDGEVEKLEEGDKVVLLRKLSRDWDWEIDGKWTQAVSIGLGERVATVSIDYVKPLSNKKSRDSRGVKGKNYGKKSFYR